jgi:Secretion system C-terminal sorting domain
MLIPLLRQNTMGRYVSATTCDLHFYLLPYLTIMRTNYFTLILACCTLSATAQIEFDLLGTSQKSLDVFVQPIMERNSFQPVVTPDNEWMVDYQLATFPNEIRRYSFSSDSFEIDDKYYRKLLYIGPYTQSEWLHEGRYFREEEDRVFYRLTSDVDEEIIYDFNLGIGDTLTTIPGIGQSARVIDGVSLTYLLDGLPRKNLSVGCINGETGEQWNAGVSFVEGIGDMDRLFSTSFACSLVSPFIRVRCFSTNGQLLYIRSDLSDCLTSSTNEFHRENIKIFPNPATDQLMLEYDPPLQIVKADILDISGRVLQTISQPGTQLDLGEIVPGFYLLRLTNHEGRQRTESFIKQ